MQNEMLPVKSFLKEITNLLLLVASLTDFESNAFEVDIYEVEGYEFPDGVPNEENGLFARIGKKVDYPYDW